MKKKQNKSDSLSIPLAKSNPAHSSTNSTASLNLDLNSQDAKSMSTQGISCLIQRSLETLLKKENFFKSPDLTKISHKERKMEFSKLSSHIRVSNKSAEYHDLPFQNAEYEKFKAKYQSSVANPRGYFLYTQNPLSRKSQTDLIGKIVNEHMVWDPNTAYNGLLRKRIHNNGKVSIIKELRDKSMGVLTEALSRKCVKEDIEALRSEVEKHYREVQEENERLLSEK